LSQHLKDIDLSVQLITLPWFLCLFIGYLPWEVSLRLLDCFFTEGPRILFQVGLAMFRLNMDKIMATHDAVSVIMLMKESTYDCNQLLEVALTEFKLQYDAINKLRNFHKLQTLSELKKQSTISAQATELKKLTRFSPAQLQGMFHEYSQVLEVESDDAFSITYEQFSTIFNKHIPWWLHSIALEKLYKLVFDTNGSGKVSFNDYVVGLDTIVHGNISSKLHICFELYAEESRLSKAQFELAVTTLFSMCTHDKDRQPFNEDIIDSAFQLADEEFKGYLDYDKFVTASILKHCASWG